MMNLQHIPFNRLTLSALNVRTIATNKADDDQLAASIKAQGLLQNLIVHPVGKNKFAVAGGGRRFKVIKGLVENGDLAKTFEIPCKVAESEAQAIDWSLAENFARSAMHVADLIAAFGTLSKQGKTDNQIAQNYGLSAAEVKRLLKLAILSPVILEALKQNEISIEHAQAFALTDSHDTQNAVYAALTEAGAHAMNPSNIRRQISGDALTNDHRLVKGMDLKEYKQRGGKTLTDLFGAKTHYLSYEIISELALKRLEDKAQLLQAEGWKWIKTCMQSQYLQYDQFANQLEPVLVDAPAELVNEYEQIQVTISELEDRQYDEDFTDEEEQKLVDLTTRFEELDKTLEAYNQYTSDQKSQSGCFVVIGSSGEIQVHYGCQTREDVKQSTNQNKAEAADNQTSDQGASEGEGLQESAALKSSLAAYKKQALQTELCAHPALVNDLLIFTLALRCLGGAAQWDAPLALDAHKNTFADIEPDTAAAVQYELAVSEANLSWINCDDNGQRFELFRKLSAKEKQKIAALCVAPTLRSDAEFTGMIEQLVGFDINRYWQPTAENYFNRLRVPALLAIGKEVIGTDWHTNASGLTKKALVESLTTDPQMVGWLPQQMK